MSPYFAMCYEICFNAMLISIIYQVDQYWAIMIFMASFA